MWRKPVASFCLRRRRPAGLFLQVKSAVGGYGKAEKEQVMEMTRRLLCLREVPKPDDTADALAIAICHCHASGTALRQFLR